MVSQVAVATVGCAIWVASVHVDYPARLALVSFIFCLLPLSVSSEPVRVPRWLEKYCLLDRFTSPLKRL